ncbi:hypothetical protein [Sulfitobacter sp. JB4-11]|uniref:hypothetical protein n=1 Tax=Sulfitobacter rhodophyticola TaxID=3238304 RepID=UPI003515FF44
MTPFLLAMLVAGSAGMALMMDFSSDGEDAVTDEDLTEDPDLPEDPEDALDLGASVVELEDGRIEVELGEDETGELVAIVHQEDQYYNGYETALTLLLLPEGTELPASGVDLPEYATTDVNGEPFEQLYPGIWEPADIAGYYGGSVLGSWDLGGVSESGSNSQNGSGAPSYNSDRVELEFVSEEPISAVYVNGESGNGLGYYPFHLEPDLSRLEGTGIVRGTDADETLTPADVSYVDGRGGDDYIEAPGAVIEGGDGDDTIIGSDSSLITGEAGEDLVIIEGPNTNAWGGSGNDTLIGAGGVNMDLYGDDGDDTLIALADIGLSGDQYSSIAGAVQGLSGADTFMVSDQGVGDTASDAPVRLSTIKNFNSSTDQLTILTRDGDVPVSVTYEDDYRYGDTNYPTHRGGHLILTYANGSVGLIKMAEVDPATITFRDVDEVLDDYPIDVPLPSVI